MPERIKTYGAEIEKSVSNRFSGQPQGVTQEYFKWLFIETTQRGYKPEYHDSQILEGYHLGVVSQTLGEQGLDNATNLLETALPVSSSLEELDNKMQEDLAMVQNSLEVEGATVINMSIHPLGSTDERSYKAFVAPKGVYRYILSRGWDHSAGIDAKAQNSPTTGVSAEQAADAVSVVIGLGAATVGIFGNSPVAEGKISGTKETRLTMWKRMMANSQSEGDRKTAQYPETRFHTLANYLDWMFGDGTNIHFVKIQNEGDYKTSSRLITIDGNPSVLQYIAEKEWIGTVFGSEEKISVKPHLAHLEGMQFAQFAGARIRWAFKEDLDLPEFLQAQKMGNQESVFASGTKYMYIEGRDPGANFPDKQLADVGEDVRRSVVIAPSAIQAGLINNLEEATKLLDSYAWEKLGKLREMAIQDGMLGEWGGISVKDLAEKVIDIAASGLQADQQWMLAYPIYVLETGKNGADRFLERLGGRIDRDSIAKAVLERNIYLNK